MSRQVDLLRLKHICSACLQRNAEKRSIHYCILVNKQIQHMVGKVLKMSVKSKSSPLPEQFLGRKLNGR